MKVEKQQKEEEKQKAAIKNSKLLSILQPLKQLYPELQRRIDYCKKKSQKFPNFILVRLQPLKMTSTHKMVYATFLFPPTYKLSYVNGTLFPKLGISDKQTLFFYIKKQLSNLERSIKELHDQYREEDNILYIQYTSDTSF